MLQCPAIFFSIIKRWKILISILRAILCTLQYMGLNTALSCFMYPPQPIPKAELWTGYSVGLPREKVGLEQYALDQTYLLGIYLHCTGLIAFCSDLCFEPFCLDINSRCCSVTERLGFLRPCSSALPRSSFFNPSWFPFLYSCSWGPTPSLCWVFCLSALVSRLENCFSLFLPYLFFFFSPLA